MMVPHIAGNGGVLRNFSVSAATGGLSSAGIQQSQLRISKCHHSVDLQAGCCHLRLACCRDEPDVPFLLP